MLAIRISARQLGMAILLFTVFTWIAPSLRMLLFGTAASSGVLDSFVTLLPDFFLLLVLLTAFLFFRTVKVSGAKLRFTLTDKVLAAFWLSNVVLGFVLAMNPKLSLLAFRITYLPVAFYFVARLFSLDPNYSAGRLLEQLLRVFAFFAVLGIILYFGFHSLSTRVAVMNGYEEGAYFIARMSSILWTPVLFGTLMAIGTLYSAWRVLQQGEKIHYLFFTLFWFCLFMSVSRGPILGCFIGLLLLLLIYRNWKSTLLLLALLAGIALSVSFFATGDLRLIRWMISSTGDTVVLQEGVTRVNRWQETWNAFRARPYGYGLGKAGAVAYRYLLNAPEAAAPWSTDGWLLKLGCETGIYGIASYLLFCLSFFYAAVKALLKKKRGLVVFALAVFLATNAQALVSNVYDFYPYITVYWLLLGLAVNEQNEPQT